MKKVLGIILIVVGLITLPQVFTSTSDAIEAVGAFIGVSIVTFLPAFFLLRNKKEENNQ